MGFGADSEILIDAVRKGLKISEEKNNCDLQHRRKDIYKKPNITY